MSTERSSAATSLLRWRPALLGLTAAAAGFSIYYLALASQEQNEDAGARGLRRSNAVRRRSSRLRRARGGVAGRDRSSPGTVAAADGRDGGEGSGRGGEIEGERERERDGGEDNAPVAHQETDEESDFDPTSSVAGGAEGGQSLLNLLYHIAEEQAHREAYVHRGVTCNSCNTLPIRGIRYRCANCPDYDLCEQCENLGVHDKTHLFYKIRIPAPFLGSNPRNQQPVWYPGKPYGLLRTVPKEVKKRLGDLTGFDRSRIDALWDQFKSLAAADWPEDPNGLRVAIDRKTWAKYCMPTMLRDHEAPSALVFDQSFTFYDDNSDGLVGFEEFLCGLAVKQSKDQHEKLRRIFRAHDLNRDGFVCRDDFMKLFTSYYTFMRELSRDLFHIMDEEILDDRSLRENLRGTQPVSSCFTGTIPPGEPSRIGEGKTMGPTGDWVVTDGGNFLRESDNGLINESDGFSTGQQTSGGGSNGGVLSNLFTEFGQSMEDWPPEFVTADDAWAALGKNTALHSITGIGEQRQVLDAAHRRLERQRHTQNAESSVNSHRQESDVGAPSEPSSPSTANGGRRSEPIDLETPATQSERQEAMQIKGPAENVSDGSFSQEFLYHATREGFDEVLDPMFKQMEDLYEYHQRCAGERARLSREIRHYRESPENETLARSWLSRLLRNWRKGEGSSSQWYNEKLMDEVIRLLVSETEVGSSEWILNLYDRIYAGTLTQDRLNSELESLVASDPDKARTLTRALRHAWLRVQQGELPNSGQLSKFLDRLDEHMQQRTDADGLPSTEVFPHNVSDGVVSVDEQLIQELLDSGEALDGEITGPWYPDAEDVNADEETTHELGPGQASPQDISALALASTSAESGQLAAPGAGVSMSAENLHDLQMEFENFFEDSIQEVQQNTAATSGQTPHVMLPTSGATGPLRTFEQRMADEMDYEPTVDPTLPQNRPDHVEDASGAGIMTQSTAPAAGAQLARESSKKFMRWSPVNQHGSLYSMEQQDHFEDREGTYFQVKLKYLAVMEIYAEQTKDRGGVARLNREEFEEIMMGGKGPKLETIGKWLDLAAF